MAGQRILAADIGGTNARFGCFFVEDGQLRLERVSWMPSSGLRDTEAVLRTLQHRLDLELSPQDVLALALAGPVAAERGQADQRVPAIGLGRGAAKVRLASLPVVQ